MRRFDGVLVGVNQDFYATVLRAAFRCGVRRDRLARAVAGGGQARTGHALRLQERGDRLGAVARQRVVYGIGTGVVGMAVDGQRRIRILDQRFRCGGQRVARVGAQCGAVGGEGYVFRHHQFDLVALLFDLHIGISQTFAQFFRLIIHIAAYPRADGAAGQRGIARALAAVGQRTDNAAHCRTAQAVNGGFAGTLLPGNGVGNAAGQCQRGGQYCNGQRFQNVHGKSFR